MSKEMPAYTTKNKTIIRNPICEHCGVGLLRDRKIDNYCSRVCRAEAASVEKINKKLDEIREDLEREEYY